MGSLGPEIGRALSLLTGALFLAAFLITVSSLGFPRRGISRRFSSLGFALPRALTPPRLRLIVGLNAVESETVAAYRLDGPVPVYFGGASQAAFSLPIVAILGCWKAQRLRPSATP